MHVSVKACKIQKSVSDSLNLELQLVVSWEVDAKNQNLVLYKSSKCSWHLSHLWSLYFVVFLIDFSLSIEMDL